MSTDVRRCWACERILPIDQFSHDRRPCVGAGQRRYICGVCSTKKRDEWVDSMSPDRYAAYITQRQETNRQTPAHQARTRERRTRRREDIRTLLHMLDWLRSRGYTIADIARASGCTWDTVERWIRTRGEGARSARRQTLDKVSRVYIAEVARMDRQQGD